MATITVYTTQYCGFCHALKHFLDEKGLIYEEKDVSDNQENLKEMLNISNQMGVPVIKIDQDVIVGFDKNRIEEIIKDKTTA